MSAVAEKTVSDKAVKKPLDDMKEVKFVPMGESEEVTLRVAFVRDVLTTPTKSGHWPSDQDVIKFMMLCRSQRLNPWCGDAYLLGYDSNDGPKFSLITAVSAILKRADSFPEYDGVESGVTVVDKDQNIVERAGSIVLPTDNLIGGWAKCHRKDRDRPAYSSVNFSVYNKGTSRWKIDPAGMIQKVAKSAALREAFPNQFSKLYIREEMENVESEQPQRISEGDVKKISGPADLAEVLKQRNAKPKTQERVQPVSGPSESAMLRDQLLAELRTVDSMDALESIEADINMSEVLDDEDREMLFKALESKRSS